MFNTADIRQTVCHSTLEQNLHSVPSFEFLFCKHFQQFKHGLQIVVVVKQILKGDISHNVNSLFSCDWLQKLKCFLFSLLSLLIFVMLEMPSKDQNSNLGQTVSFVYFCKKNADWKFHVNSLHIVILCHISWENVEYLIQYGSFNSPFLYHS